MSLGLVVGPDILTLNIFNGMFMRREILLMKGDQISRCFWSNLHGLVCDGGKLDDWLVMEITVWFA